MGNGLGVYLPLTLLGQNEQIPAEIIETNDDCLCFTDPSSLLIGVINLDIYIFFLVNHIGYKESNTYLVFLGTSIYFCRSQYFMSEKIFLYSFEILMGKVITAHELIFTSLQLMRCT